VSQWGNPLKAIPEWRKLVASRYPVAMTLLPVPFKIGNIVSSVGWLAHRFIVHEILREAFCRQRPSPI
jgi:hypothetical protein